MSQPSPPPPSPPIDREIDGYRLVRELGRGGMGVVYEAIDRDDPAGRVALKVLHPHLLPDIRHWQRFLNEARVLSRVQHRGLVRILATGQTAAEVYLVMEYLAGESLKARLLRAEGHRLTHKEASDIAEQVARALAAVHKKRIVHRDLKPENLMLIETGEGRVRVKLLDFGIAKVLDGTVYTGTGTVLGTAAYMSPEQCLGAELCDERSDVYSLGVLLYEMLAGEAPYRGGLLQVMDQHRSATPPPLPPGVPPALDELVRNMLAKEPEMRPVMRDVVATLREPRPDLDRSSRPHPRLQPEPPGGAFNPYWYVHRERAERAAQSYLSTPGKPTILWGPEFFGKTWLMEYLLQHEQRRHGESCRVARVSLAFCSLETRRSYDLFLGELLTQVSDELDRTVPASFATPGERPPNRRLTQLMRQLLAEGPGPLLLAIDRADAILDCDFRDDFFGMLRGWAEYAGTGRPEWSRLRLLLCISTTPLRLTANVHNSPFSGLSEPIELDDLCAEGALRLGQRYGAPWDQREAVDQLMALVGGHPYLLRLAMHNGVLHGHDPGRLLVGGGDGIFDRHLRHCQKALTAQPGLLQVLQRVGQSGVGQLEGEIYEQLHRMGLVVRDPSGTYRLRCRLYERLLD